MQPASQDKSPSSQLQKDEFDLVGPLSTESPSQLSEPNTPYPFAPPVHPLNAAAALPPSAVHLAKHQDQLLHGNESYETAHGGSKAQHEEALAGPLLEVPSASGAGPFSTYSGPGSTSSSTPASPSAAPLPTRRSSFLPRGMSTHLHKALKATAAAASKASAAIAPPPNTPLPPSSWQEGVSANPQQPAMSLPIPTGGQDQDPWGPSGPASTGNQDRKETGKPWWQQQLQNLQQNLHSSQQLQADSVSHSDADSDAASAPVTHSAMLNGLVQAQPLSENGDVTSPGGEPSAYGDQQAGAVLHRTGFAPPPSDPGPPRQGSQPEFPRTAAQQHSDVSADGSDQYRLQLDVDRMRIMESLGDADSMSVSMSQPQQTPSLAAPSGEGGELSQQGPVSNSLLVSGGPSHFQVRPYQQHSYCSSGLLLSGWLRC